MRKLALFLTTSYAMTLLAGLGITAVGLTIAPKKAEARCYWRWKKSWRCYRGNCSWKYSKYKVCSGRHGVVTNSYHRKTYRNRYGTTVSRSLNRRSYRTRYGTKTTYRTKTHIRTRYGTKTTYQTQTRYRSRCRYRNVRKRLCSRTRGYYVTRAVWRRGYRRWSRVYVPGRYKCYYRWVRQRSCDY